MNGRTNGTTIAIALLVVALTVPVAAAAQDATAPGAAAEDETFLAGGEGAAPAAEPAVICSRLLPLLNRLER